MIKEGCSNFCVYCMVPYGSGGAARHTLFGAYLFASSLVSVNELARDLQSDILLVNVL